MCHSMSVELMQEPYNITFAGKGTTYHPPGGPGIRVDSLLYSGCSVTAF